MSASFRVTLDTSPPSQPVLLINDGVSATGTPVVKALLLSGSTDVDQMKVWGDVDPTTDLGVQQVEEDSAWRAFDPEGLYVELAAGNGRKHLYARLRDDVGNQTPTVSAWVDLDTSLPQVSIVTPADRARLSLVDGYDAATFGWQATMGYDAYEVRLVPKGASPRGAGNVLLSGGPGPGGSTVTTTVTAEQIHLASVGDGAKVVKVFVRVGSTWSV